MKAHWGSGIIAQLSALDGGDWSATRRGRFIPGEKSPGTNWIGVYVRGV
jgi:hypothetical protein